MQAFYDYRFHILGFLFLVNTCFFWPGHIMFDSAAQYQQAILGQYTDHHPPLMSFIWRYIDHIYSGHGLMFVLQQLLIYSSVFVLLKTADLLPLHNRPLMSLLLLVFPSYPQVLMYDVVILKDVQFAFSFLLAASILAYYTVSTKRPNLAVICLLLGIMIYGAAVKYQGQFCVIILATWLGCLLCIKSKLIYKLALATLIYSFILTSIFTINNLLVPQTSKNYSWQLVKLYDLAAISIATHQDLIPEFNKKPDYTFKQLEQRFEYPAVDSLALAEDPILEITKSAENMSSLYRIWFATVIRYPLPYLKHRSINISYMLLAAPGYKYSHEDQANDKDKVKYANVMDAPYVLINDMPKDFLLYGVIDGIYRTVFFMFMSYLPVIILAVAYLMLSLRSWNTSKAAPVLLGFSSISLLMVGILFFMSMAGTPRYAYISIVMIHAMHVFAYACYSARKETVN